MGAKTSIVQIFGDDVTLPHTGYLVATIASFWLPSPAVNGTLVQTGRLGVSGRVFGRPGGQRECGTIGITFAAGGDSDIRENAIAAIIDLNATTTVGVQAVQLRYHGCASFGHTTLNVIDRWVISDIPGARNRFRGHGAIRGGVRTTPQI